MGDVYAYTFSRHRIAESVARIRQPIDTLPVLEKLYRGRETEALSVLALNSKNDVIGVEVVYTGNVAASLVRVAEVFRFPVRVNAAGIIVAHNHPSGDPTPSPDDLHLTAEILAAGRILDIEVLDHIILGDAMAGYSTPFRSMRDDGIAFDRTPREVLANA